MRNFTFPMTSCPITDGETAPATKWWRRVMRPINDKFDDLDSDDSGWLTPGLQNFWQNFAPTGYSNRAYRRRHGVTYLKGIIASGTANADMFTIPAGYGPEYDQIYIVPCNSGTVRLDVRSDINSPSGSADGGVRATTYYMGGNNSFVFLDGIFWPVYNPQ